MHINTPKKLSGRVAIMGCALLPLSAIAEVAPDEEGTLNEVVVTATHRAEDVLTIPASVSALDGAALADRNVVSAEDLTRAVPNVSFQAGGGPGLDKIEIRGISSSSGSSTVALYMDEVPITVKNFYNGGVEPRFFDLDRVEVLRGPQGDLYGASSMGGAIRYLSSQPKLDAFEGEVNVMGSGTEHGAGNYEFQGIWNAPIASNQLAVRLGADFGHDGGYIDNYSPAGTLNRNNVNSDNWTVLRGSFKWTPTASFSALGSVFWQDERTADTSVFYPDFGLYEQQKLVAEPSTDSLLISSLTLSQDLPFAKLESITGYFRQNFNRVEDGTYYNSEYLGMLIDADPPNGIAGKGYLIGNLPGPQLDGTQNKTITEELRLTSNSTPSDLFSWIGGLFYSDYTINRYANAYVKNFNQTFEQIYGERPQDSDVFFGSTFPDDYVAFSNAHFAEKQYAGYANVSLAPTSWLKLSAGVRYNHSKISYFQSQSGYFGGGVLSSYTRSGDFNATTPHFSITYNPDRDLTLYTTVAKGNRVGGPEGFVPTNVCGSDLASIGLTSAPQTFDSDSLWSYEGGVKGRFFDSRVVLSASYYYVNWSNIQQTINLPTCGYTVTTNVGNAETQGPELELTVHPVTGLTFGLSGSVTHAVLTSVKSSVGASTGDWILNVPKAMAAVHLDYRHPLSAELTGFVEGDYNYTGSSRGAYDVTNPDYDRSPYDVVNLRLGLIRGPYQLALFATNLLNDHTIIQRPSLLFLPEAYALRPRTIGLSLRAKF